MAITPPSDILLDVASAADPAKVRAATARLAALAADPGAQNVDFSEALSRAKAQGGLGSNGLSGARGLSSGDPSSALSLPSTITAPRDAVNNKPTAYQKFEAQVLQSFIETMLPKDDASFGDQDSSDVYRSLMAEQLAKQMADAGGIGLAKAIEAVHPPSSTGQKSQG
jgi:peptidoglycan hydrolase FlgJ